MTRSFWDDVQVPSVLGKVIAYRVDPANRWGFYWARDFGGGYLMIFEFGAGVSRPARLPQLHGMTVSIGEGDSSDGQRILFRLDDVEHLEVFTHLCQDIVHCASAAETEAEALSLAVGRTWRWHELLRGASSGRLSFQQQLGLFGELTFLRDYLVPAHGVGVAVTGWRGPFRAPQDFVLANGMIEVKSVTGASGGDLHISSAEQLSVGALSRLFMCVQTFDARDASARDGETLDSMVHAVRALIASEAPEMLMDWGTAIAAAGWAEGEDYSDVVWRPMGMEVFEVVGDFPRIGTEDLRFGVREVSYSITMGSCVPYKSSIEVALAAVSGA